MLLHSSSTLGIFPLSSPSNVESNATVFIACARWSAAPQLSSSLTDLPAELARALRKNRARRRRNPGAARLFPPTTEVDRRRPHLWKGSRLSFPEPVGASTHYRKLLVYAPPTLPPKTRAFSYRRARSRLPVRAAVARLIGARARAAGCASRDRSGWARRSRPPATTTRTGAHLGGGVAAFVTWARTRAHAHTRARARARADCNRKCRPPKDRKSAAS